MIAYPKMKKPMEAMQKSIRFFIRMLAVFLARIRPASSMPKPACIRNTRKAAISTHMVSIPTMMSAIWVATDASCA